MPNPLKLNYHDTDKNPQAFKLQPQGLNNIVSIQGPAQSWQKYYNYFHIIMLINKMIFDVDKKDEIKNADSNQKMETAKRNRKMEGK